MIEADEDHVRVEVQQPTSAAEVRLVEPSIEGPAQVGGFGLHLVDQTADTWGYEAGPPGWVWFEFRALVPSGLVEPDHGELTAALAVPG